MQKCRLNAAVFLITIIIKKKNKKTTRQTSPDTCGGERNAFWLTYIHYNIFHLKNSKHIIKNVFVKANEIVKHIVFNR